MNPITVTYTATHLILTIFNNETTLTFHMDNTSMMPINAFELSEVGSEFQLNFIGPRFGTNPVTINGIVNIGTLGESGKLITVTTIKWGNNTDTITTPVVGNLISALSTIFTSNGSVEILQTLQLNTPVPPVPPADGSTVTLIKGGNGNPLLMELNGFSTTHNMSTFIADSVDLTTFSDVYRLHVSEANILKYFNLEDPAGISFTNDFLKELDDIETISERRSTGLGFINSNGDNFCKGFIKYTARCLLGISNDESYSLFDKRSRTQVARECASLGCIGLSAMKQKSRVADDIISTITETRGIVKFLVGDVYYFYVTSVVAPNQLKSNLTGVLGGPSSIPNYVAKFEIVVNNTPLVNNSDAVYSPLTYSDTLPSGNRFTSTGTYATTTHPREDKTVIGFNVG